MQQAVYITKKERQLAFFFCLDYDLFSYSEAMLRSFISSFPSVVYAYSMRSA